MVVVVIQETDLMVDLVVVLLVDFLDQVVVEDHMVMMVGGANGSPLGGDNYRGGGGGGAGGAGNSGSWCRSWW